MLHDEEIRDILKDFPNIKLSYETLLHKKVYDADLIMAIPEGHKYFAWFTTYKNDNVCFLLQLSDKKHIVHVRICKQAFHAKLYYGTILYGTMFTYNNISCFAIENMYSWQGTFLYQTLFSKKLEYMRDLLNKYILQDTNSYKHLLFGMPLFVKGGTQFTKLLNDIESLPYKIKTVQFRYLQKENNEVLFVNYFKPKTSYKENQLHFKKNETVFKVVPDIQNDIYHLYSHKNGQFEYYDIAFIPNYKTSVFMNTLFRTIKENVNLDALEESDDEEEFENAKSDKFVDLEKSFLMNCVYNSKFKRWTPVSTFEKINL